MSSIVQDCKYSGYLFSFLIFHTGKLYFHTFLIFLPALQRDFFIVLGLLYMCPICNTGVQVPDFNAHTTTRSFLQLFESKSIRGIVFQALQQRQLPLSGVHLHIGSYDRDRLMALSAAPALSHFRLPSSRCSWLAAPSSLTICVRSSSHYAANV